MKTKNSVVWGMMALALAAFWVSIRSETDQMQYTLVAIGIWAIAFLLNRYWK